MIRKAFFIFLFFSYSLVSAQESANFSQFYMNPYRINPAYAGIEGRGAMFLTYRKQWVGIEGAPTVMNFSFHNTTNSNANLGININNDAIGIRNSTSFALTLGYTLPVSKDQYVRFGITAGVAMNTFDVDKLGDALLADPQLEGLLENNFNVVGDVGLSYHNKYLSIGASAPNLFSSSYDSISSFGIGNFAAAERLIFNASYRYYFGFEDKFAIEPHILYRLRGPLSSQYEAALIFHMNHAFWLGASYKQNYGISGTGGIKINALFALGYSYSIAGGELNSSTHEVQINLLFAKKLRHKQILSFTDSKKPIVKKTRRQLLAEQHKAERERIAADRAAAAKAAIEKAEKEKQDLLAAEKATADRIAQEQRAAEQSQQQAESNRIAQQQRDDAQSQQQAESDRIAQQQRDDAQRQQQAESDRIAQQQRDDAQSQQQAESDRIAQQQQEDAQRQEQAESDRNAQQQREDAQQQQFAEAERLAQQHQAELLRQEKAAAERLAQQQAAKSQETKIDEKGNVESAFTTDEKVTVKRGGHFLELKPGEYVVVGVFTEFEHAELFSDNLFERGHKTRFGYISETKLWYVHLYESEDGDVARGERDKYRKLNLFKKAWVLSVEH